MGFIKKWIKKHREKIQQRDDLCAEWIANIDNALKEQEELFKTENEFIPSEISDAWERKVVSLSQMLSMGNLTKVKKAKNYSSLLQKREEFLYAIQNFHAAISKHNDNVAVQKAKDVYSIIGKVEGKDLDVQQLSCISKSAHNHLIIAGAGTGKTTTVVGKIKYLLKTEQYKPEDILVLSYTNVSASEMCDRIKKETRQDIAASTFHKLGMNIIQSVENKQPNISTLDLRSFIQQQLELKMQEPNYLHMLSQYLLYNRVNDKSEFDFKNKQEYEEYIRLNPPTTIAKEIVKSYGEMDIANFLDENGVDYEYEAPYMIDTANEKYGQYHPDFYLPSYDIYIEYFGINRDGEVPSYFSGSAGMTPTETYQASMKWKRELHKKNGTTMIECFAYEKFDGTLLGNLKLHLEENEIHLCPKSAEELWKEVGEENHSILDGVIELFQTLINLIKSNNYAFDKVYQLIIGREQEEKNRKILTLLEPIYNAYCQHLKDNHEIDFMDMINRATQYVQEGKFKNPYSYVIVDEYQDISKARFLLLEALRESKDYDLFCVGDDWQSIYRFAGSDVGYILNFSKHWGPTEISRIETTYRFPQNLIDISSQFIMKNPMQIRKSIRGITQSVGFPLGEVNGYQDKYAVEFMLNRLDDLPRNSTVYFIGRYSFDIDILNKNPYLQCRYNNQTKEREVHYVKRADLKMQFLTAHKAKGLQADYVFIINNKNTRMGFPSKVQDASILDLLLDNSDTYPLAEERRLYYVAMTRARKKVVLLTVKDQESEFVNELHQYYGEEMQRERFECPKCGGRLVRKRGPYGEFYGCSNYRNTGCNYIRRIKSSL